ncbi:T9SS type A sorting domain-containing protein [Flavobacterium franklandianum]|uniref:T9SS type A sorting domain-containing protein n=1 Tax=Flavobacterium franklandianum TaxID=2594430 RepID=A0A553CKW3_9FLAO|nr:FG-GAP-like repeat-containing protein [Flavobacterium franklandianum]TRX21085.1 T9SS type A sorting domain-containing protein [Flavobacterium franklandianum]TRX29128.1 T9SS type A sorting domain-containing protein [Flavobacterium franklandianum]
MKNNYLSNFKILLVFFSFVISSLAQPAQDYTQKFNGDQIFLSSTNSTLNLGNVFTMEAWIFLKSASAYGIVMGKTLDPRSNDPFQNYVIAFDGTGLKPEFVQTTGLAGSYATATSPNEIALNTWTHLAATLNLGVLRLYVNGVLVATQNSPGFPNASPNVPFSIGSGATPASQTTCCGINGAIKQVRVWNVERTSAEILSNKEVNLSGNEAGLLACYPMNENLGQIITDFSPNANHLIRGITSNTESQDPVSGLISDLGPFFEFSVINLPTISHSYEDIYVINFNNDGNEDFLVSSLIWPPTIPASSAPLLTFSNNGDMNFTNTNSILGSNQVVHPRDYCIGDFNGDNKTDLFIADHGTDVSPFPGGQNRFYTQNSNGELQDVAGNIPNVLDFSHNTATADIDNDGDLDIYVCNIYNSTSVGPRFLINNGSGVFYVSTTNFPSEIANLSSVYMSSRFVDIDKDNDQDLILGAIDGGGIAKDLILLNNGTGTFTSGIPLPDRHGSSTWGTVSMAVADFNNDTWPDLLMSTLYQYQKCQIQLLINNQNGTFTDATANIPQNWGTASNNWIKWIEAGDFNNDGKIDFACTSHFSPQPKLFFNTGNANFIDASDILTIPSGNNVASMRARDFDNDGRIDIAILCGNKVIMAKNIKNYEVTSPLDSEEFDLDATNDILIYPNPFSENLKFATNSGTEIKMVSIYGIDGKLVFNGVPKNGKIEVAHLNEGLYILKVKTSMSTTTRKLLKK